jgi:SecD/SecF fusion protein
MKEFRFKILIIIGVFALSVFYIYPTFSDYQNTQNISKNLAAIEDSIKLANPDISDDDLKSVLEIKEDSLIALDPSIKADREKRIKLGLDLQGGMYLVMEVNTAKLLENLARDPDETYNNLLEQSAIEANQSGDNVVTILARKLQENGIRLSRYFGSIRDEDTDIIDDLLEQEADAVTRAIEIINNRVNQYGVSEPNIQKQGARRIIVELPGVAKEEEAKQLLKGSALLEFKLVKDAEFTYPILSRIDEVIAGDVAADTSTASDSLLADLAETDEEASKAKFAKEHPFLYVAQINPQSQYADAYVKSEDREKVLNYLSRPDVKKIIPDNVEFLFGAKPFKTNEGEEIYVLYLVNKQPELTGGVIVDASANIHQSTSAPIVNMQMNSEGALDWARITGANINKRCAIVLDGFVYSAPNINEKIPSGSSQISGIDNLDEAKLLEIVLKAGALPAPVDIIEERTVGPSLGQDSISQGFNSTIIGFLLVAVFMIVYYRKAGSVADLALFFTILIILGLLAAFKATLTLPGIAGIILTIGMAVDANVLIYERIREELSTGKTVKAAIESGYLNSYSAIFDSNITTFFTGIILYQFGSGPVQGFALTLMIGIVASLFSALVITRLIFDILASKGAKLNIG